MARRKFEIGNITDVSGEVNIAGGNIYRGYTIEQVAILLKQITSTFQPKPFDGRCPYKGLDVFNEEDAELFFGRENQLEDLISRMKKSQTVFITGPSGSGKSSLVRAGLIHALKQGAIKNLHSESWLYETMDPGREPIKELARVTASLVGKLDAGEDIRTRGLSDATILARWCEVALKEGREKRAVIFIDQFEEIFAQVINEAERVAFLNLITHPATIENGRVIILFTMRSDFVTNCATYPQLNGLINQQFIQIGSMKPDELVSAIALPALRVGLHIHPDLIAQIINDMQGEPGVLPLMQFALRDLFDSQEEKGGIISLTLNDYIKRGGIHKSLERHADYAFSKLSESEQGLARSIFSGLIEIRRGAQDTRRTALFDELITANANVANVQAVVQKLADARLIITDERSGKHIITISHEKLIEAWPWLKRLVDENRDLIAMKNEILNDAKEWNDRKRDPSYLYSGARLANAKEQLEKRKLLLNGLAQDFVKAGAAKQRRGQLVFIGGISAVITMLIVAVIIFSNQSSVNLKLAQQNEAIAYTAQAASSLAVNNGATAQANAQLARAGEIAAQATSQRDQHFDLSLLLSIESFLAANTPSSRILLFNNMQTNPQLIQYLSSHKDAISSLAFSPDGSILASGSNDKTIILWDVKTSRPIGPPLKGHSDSVRSVAFSPDGKTLASGSNDGEIILWNIETQMPVGQPLIHVDTQDLYYLDDPFGRLQHSVVSYNTFITSLAFSPDGKILASGYGDETVILWDLVTHRPIGQPMKWDSGFLSILKFSPDGKTLAFVSDNGTFNLWNVTLQKPLIRSLKVSVASGSFAFSPDGKLLSSSGDDESITLWDLDTYQPVGSLTGHKGTINSMAFSPDSKILASGNDDRTILLWDIESRQQIGQPLQGHSSAVENVTFSPDGKTLVSGDRDGVIIFWKVPSYRVVNQNLDENLSDDANIALSLNGVPDMSLGPDGVSSLAFSPNGKILASGSNLGTIFLWDMATHHRVGQLSQEGQVISLAFTPDGKILASSGFNGRIILWSMATHRSIGQLLKGSDFYINSLAFSPDGMLLASGGCAKQDTSICTQGDVTVWDVASLNSITQFFNGINNYGFDVAFSPNGKTLASGNFDGTITLWDVENRQFVSQPFKANNFVFKVLFSSDSKRLATFQNDTLIFWDLNTNKPVESMNYGNETAVALSPVGKLLATGENDGLVTLWDLETHQPLGSLRGHKNFLDSVAFSPDNKLLASGSDDKTIILWDIDPQSWINKTCLRVGRNLTQAEWTLYFPNEEYRATCPQWPIEPKPSTVTPNPTP